MPSPNIPIPTQWRVRANGDSYIAILPRNRANARAGVTVAEEPPRQVSSDNCSDLAQKEFKGFPGRPVRLP